MERIPFAKPSIGEEEIAEVVDTLRSGWLTTGPKTQRFERAFADYVGVPNALGTSSCTGALQIALGALGIGPDDEVLTSTMTFAATANVIVHSGAKPVLCDVDDDTLNISVNDIEKKLTPKSRAVIAVHYAGRPCDVTALKRICDARSLLLIEDCAHAVGASVEGRACGAWGDAGAFSFYANKNMTTGEGGMLTTRRDDVAATARVLRLQGMTRDVFRRGDSSLPSWRYDIVAAGYKHPMSDIQAAIGLHQLARFDSTQAARRRVVDGYFEKLHGIKGLRLPERVKADTVHAWHLYVARVTSEARLTRDELFAKLLERRIECSVHFVPLHLHPYYRDVWHYEHGQLPVAEKAFDEIISLPLYPTMTEDDQARVAGTIRELLS
jgi:dTDP-4-amino-4,6-dideoxygalactose transaminase